ncbi:MAG: glycoprotein [Hangzhou rhabdovirus 4]|uniref:Glycoprotein n=1 Tax=Hangzhou rhabdovirus 4 TaxID=2905393 RepID=A0A8K1XCL3_9RHAB|nr:MAG: glycoprotein [Hangzhou rhabdovirus 4]
MDTLCIFSWLIGLAYGGLMVVPDTENAQWIPISTKTVQCPQRLFIPSSGSGDNHIPIKFTRPLAGISTKRKGVICRKMVYKTTCIWGIFSDEVSHSIQDAWIKDDECRSVVLGWMKGERTITPPFPDKECGRWGVSRSATNVALYVNELDISFDPYSNRLIDPVFVGGQAYRKGRLEPITTVHSSMKWMEIEDKSNDKCEMSTSHGYAFSQVWRSGYSKEDLNSIKFWGPDFTEKPFKGSCVISICGKTGYKFSDGTWGSIEMLDPKDHDIEGNLYNAAGPCSPGTVIWQMTPDSRFVVEQEMLEKLILHTRCLETLTKISRGDNLSPVDLSHLAQTYPGEGPAFLFKNKSIHTSVVPYVMVNTTGIPLQSDLLGFKLDGSRVLNKNWEMVGELEVGPNGISRKAGKTIFPLDTLLGSEIDWSMLHPEIYHEVNRPSLAMHLVYSADERTYLFSQDNHTGWLQPMSETITAVTSDVIARTKQWFSSFHGWFLSVSLIVLVLCICKYVIPSFSYCKKTNTSYSHPAGLRGVKINKPEEGW